MNVVAFPTVLTCMKPFPGFTVGASYPAVHEDEDSFVVIDDQGEDAWFAKGGANPVINLARQPEPPAASPELYVLAHVDSSGNIVRFPKGGGSSSIPRIKAYDSLGAARRGRAQNGGKIVKITGMEVVE